MFACLTGAVCLCACAQTYQPAMLLERLKNRGPVLLSSNNPFLAANKFLSYQAERSPDIAGFLRFRGAPAAIEVQREMLSSASMLFYYPENGEYYQLDEVSNTWIIGGPFPMSNATLNKIHALLGLDSRDFNPPPFQFNPPGALPPPVQVPLPQIPSATDKVLPGTAARSPVEARKTPGTSIRVYQELARQYGGSPAEISPRGDLVHYVTFEEESLEMIARWYTFDALNTKKLATLNSRSPSERLAIGDPIIVPKYLLKNSSRMSEPAYKAVKVLMASDR